MFDDNEADAGMGSLRVMAMIVMFVGTCIFFAFKVGVKTCDATGKVASWGVAQYKNRKGRE